MNNSKSDLVETEHFITEQAVSNNQDMTAFCLNLFADTFSDESNDIFEKAVAGYERLQIFRDGKLITGANTGNPTLAPIDVPPDFGGEGIFRHRLSASETDGLYDETCLACRLGWDYRGREIFATLKAASRMAFGRMTEGKDHLVLGEMKRLFDAIAGSKTIRRALDDTKRLHFLVNESAKVVWSRLPEGPVESEGIDLLIAQVVQSLMQTPEPSASDDNQRRPENMKVSHLKFVDRSYRLISMTLAAASQTSQFRTEKVLLDGLVHKLKGKLGAIMTAADYLGHSGHRITDEEGAQLIEIIDRAAEQMGIIINRFEEYTNLPEPKPQSLDLVTWLQNTTAAKAVKEYPIHVVSKPEKLTIITDEYLLRLALSELIDNAHEAGTDIDPVKVTLDGDVDSVSLVVSGAMPPASGAWTIVSDNIALPFVSTKPNRAGLGLTMAREAISRLGGRLEIAMSDQNGFMARLIFPSSFMEINRQ